MVLTTILDHHLSPELWVWHENRQSAFLIFEMKDLANVSYGRSQHPEASLFVKMLREDREARLAASRSMSFHRNEDREVLVARAAVGIIECTSCVSNDSTEPFRTYATSAGVALLERHRQVQRKTKKSNVIPCFPGCLTQLVPDGKCRRVREHYESHMEDAGVWDYYTEYGSFLTTRLSIY